MKALHRADPASRHPTPHHRRGHRDTPPRGAPATSQLLQPPDPGPAPQWPSHRARITLKPLPERPPPLFRGYRPSAFGVIAVLLWLVVLAAILWPHGHR